MTAAMLAGCGAANTAQTTAAETAATAETASAAETGAAETEATAEAARPVTNLSQIDMTKWQYNADDNVYYQIGIQYCEKPADSSIETLSVFVPGDYMTAKDNGDGTFTCTVSTTAKVGSYTAETAPIMIPVNTPGYASQPALTEYQSFKDYTDQGFVYVHAGCRGREAGAPSGVTDLKAAIRYIRYNAGVIAGDMDRFFTFGMSGGGAQSALLGSTGDSALYTPYLDEIGAVEGVSDAVDGSMCWCPITNLDTADEAYEWNMGVSRTGLDSDTQTLSDNLADAFAEYVNATGFKDENGNVLTLEKSDSGNYQAGTYYDYMKKVIETSLNNFLSDTVFPYDADSAGGMGGGMGGDMGGGKPAGMPDGAGAPPAGTDQAAAGAQESAAGTDAAAAGGQTDFTAIDNIARTQTAGTITLSGTYNTAQDYINALNAAGTWVNYDAKTNTATITSIADFVKAVKPASKGVGAFDSLDKSQGENTLFGYNDGSGAHFDSIMAKILAGTSYADAFTTDLQKKDSAGNTAETRVNMYTPLYYLMDAYEGYQTSSVAKYWRIRTGVFQGDTSITTETNLALALENYSGVKSVDFATVWGMKHVMAERTGDSTANFIQWVNDCLASEA